MNYINPEIDTLASDRRLDDLRALPISSQDIIASDVFNKMVKNPQQSEIGKLRLIRHDMALFRQSLNL